MYRGSKVSVSIPCRNEGTHLDVVIKRMPSFVDEIIVVSNRSTDDTVKVAKQLGTKAYEDNRTASGIGYGFAHMTGIQKSTGDIIVGVDGDDTYPIEDLSRAIDFLLDEGLDFVSCNRYPLQPGTKIPLKLRIGVGILNIETRLLYGVKIQDILSGMWVFRKGAKKHLQLTMGDWNLSPQIKINAATNPKLKFSEYSIAQHQRQGVSKQDYLKTGMSHLIWILKNRFAPQKGIQVHDEK